MIDALAPQDALHTPVEREGAEATVTAIGSLAGESAATILDAIGDPAIRLAIDHAATHLFDDDGRGLPRRSRHPLAA